MNKDLLLIFGTAGIVLLFAWFGLRPALVRSLCQRFVYDSYLRSLSEEAEESYNLCLRRWGEVPAPRTQKTHRGNVLPPEAR